MTKMISEDIKKTFSHGWKQLSYVYFLVFDIETQYKAIVGVASVEVFSILIKVGVSVKRYKDKEPVKLDSSLS